MPLNNFYNVSRNNGNWYDKKAKDNDPKQAKDYHEHTIKQFKELKPNPGIQPGAVNFALNIEQIIQIVEEHEGYDLDVQLGFHDQYDEDGYLVPRVSVGADPEFFLKDARNRNISAHGIVPGNKREPFKLKKGAIQLDGTAVEFNIAPATTQVEFEKNIRSVLGEVRDMVPKQYRFNFSPSVKYTPMYFKKIPEGCKELGCDPDFDAYTYGKPNERPDNKTTMRTGAGHLHIGWDADARIDVTDRSHVLDCCLLAKNLDAIFSMIEKNWDTDTERRKMYGKLGAFRPKPYGMEYRSLSNAWVKYPKLWPFLFNICKSVYGYTLRGTDLSTVFNLPGTLTPDQFNLYCRRMRKFSNFTFPSDFAKEVYGA